MHFIIDTLGELILIYVIAKIQANKYAKNQPISWWWHPVWVIPFVLYAFIMYLCHDRLIVLALVLERVLFFFPILNALRIPKMPFFYIHGESEHGSWWDRQFEKLNPVVFEIIWLVLTSGYAALFFSILYFRIN